MNQQIQSKEFKQIYAESAESLRSRLTEQEFSNLMNNAIEKMRVVDETLSFQESEISELLPHLVDIETWKCKLNKLDKNGKRLEVMTSWVKDMETRKFKLNSLSVIETSESENFKIFHV